MIIRVLINLVHYNIGVTLGYVNLEATSLKRYRGFRVCEHHEHGLFLFWVAKNFILIHLIIVLTLD